MSHQPHLRILHRNSKPSHTPARDPHTIRRTTRYVPLFLLLLLTSAFTSSDKHTPIKGRVMIVNAFADYKVQVVEHFSDMDIRIVTSSPDNCEWIIVDAFPDFTITLVDHFPDFTVRFVDHFPKVNNEKNMAKFLNP